jgi:hypothetical protein
MEIYGALYDKDTKFTDTETKQVYRNYSKKSIALVADYYVTKLKGMAQVKPMREWFDDFVYTDTKSNKLFTHLGGGIGDILAISSLYSFLDEYQIKTFIVPKLFTVFDWFETSNFTLHDSFDVIFKDYTFAARRTNPYKRIRLEFSAIESHDKDWYAGFFERIGIKQIDKGYCSPALRTIRITDKESHIDTSRKSLIISHRASCQMRSSRFEDFYKPIKKAYPDYDLYVHDTDLHETDKQYIATNKVKINIIPKCSISDYLLNLFDATMVVCTDTSAIHFREGIHKPCLAIFGAMTVESRTAHYKFTHSFNIQSNCKFQPCFIHELQKGMVCKLAKKGDYLAPCQTGDNFQEQLYTQLKSYRYVTSTGKQNSN